MVIIGRIEFATAILQEGVSVLTTTPPIRIGLVGSGFMGRCHANAFRSVAGHFGSIAPPVLEMVADITAEAAAAAASQLGFVRSTGDWRELVAAPEIDIVSITTPNALHESIALAAIAAGKAVYCEKPLASASASARMTAAAEAAGAITLVGFNFLRNPMVALARDFVASGELGEIIGFRGIHAEDYMADPALPHSFRTDPAGGGALGDLGSHIIAMTRHLLGPVEAVCGVLSTVHRMRPESTHTAQQRSVTVDDRAVFLGRFASGMVGSFEACWAASGRKMQLAFEITGTRGSLAFTQERMNELRFYEPNQSPRQAGFKILEAGPAHPPYEAFCPAPGHHLGFNDLKVIEVAILLDAVARGTPIDSDFREGWAVQETVEAVSRSASAGGWELVRLPGKREQ